MAGLLTQEGEGFVGAKWFSTQHILWLEFLCPIESKVILLFWQLLLAQGCVRRKSWLKQDGLEMRWEDLVLSFMSLHNRWIKVRNLNGWNKIFNKGEMSKNYRLGPEVYLYSFIVSIEEYGQKKVDTQPRLSTYFETWDCRKESGSQCSLACRDKCVCFF